MRSVRIVLSAGLVLGLATLVSTGAMAASVSASSKSGARGPGSGSSVSHAATVSAPGVARAGVTTAPGRVGVSANVLGAQVAIGLGRNNSGGLTAAVANAAQQSNTVRVTKVKVNP